MAIKALELHHHAVRVAPSAVDEVRDFYVDVLGLQVDPGRRVRAGFPGHWLDVGDHSQLHLMGIEDAASADIEPTQPHVALAVADIVVAREELERRGIPHRALDRPQGPHATQVFLRDPAGNLVELHQLGTCRCAARSRTGTADVEPYARVQGAVMFADMRGFTGLAERLRPDAVVPLLNEYFTVLTGITDQHGGTVFHMAGDGLMAGFGVPPAEDPTQPHEDAAERAVAAAREMLTSFGMLARRWKAALDVDTGLGIGINSGEVIAGNVGSAAHRSYTLIGDTVNVAARLSQRARAGEALFSSDVKRSLDARGCRDVPALALPSLQLRGRAMPVEIWCIPADERIDFRPLA
jgi:class 3 adenylate cyclase